MAEFNSESYICQNIKDKFKEGGIGAVRKHVESNLDQWKSETVSIAVTGRCGVGKSTYINAFRNMQDDDPGAAETGVDQVTTVITDYADPNNPNIKLFDLPGVGTEMFPKNKYLEIIDFNRFDNFILMTAGQFTENDTWLCEELMARNKPFYLVRTKVACDVRNKNLGRSVEIPEVEIIDEMRTKYRNRKLLKDKSVNIYLIDSFEQMNENLDFMTLRKDVVECLPKQKKETLLYAIQDYTKFTPELIKSKGEMLRERIWKIALLSGIVGLVPIPLVSLQVDLVLVHREMKFFAKQLGIEEGDSMNKVRSSSWSVKAIDTMKGIVDKWRKNVSIEVVNALLASETLETATKLIPIIGSLLGMGTSFVGTALVLHKLLDKMITDATNINELIRTELEGHCKIGVQR